LNGSRKTREQSALTGFEASYLQDVKALRLSYPAAFKLIAGTMLHCKREAVEAQSGIAGQQKQRVTCHNGDIMPGGCLQWLDMLFSSNRVAVHTEMPRRLRQKPCDLAAYPW
jgi:hypothetical protein